MNSPEPDRSPADSEQSLRLLFVVDSTFPTLGGAETQARRLAAALRERGHSVSFVAPRVVPGQSLEDTIDGFSVVRIDYPHVKLFGGIWMTIKFGKYLLREAHKYDAVHVHITRLFAAAAAALRPRFKKPVIAKISGYFEFNGGILDQSKRWLPVNFAIRRALRNLDYFQTISLETRAKLLEAGYSESQIQFVPNGIDIPPRRRLEQRDPSKPVVFGYCGRLRHVKGVHVLLDAFAALVKNNPERTIQLHLVGDGNERDNLKKQCADHGINSQVFFLGQMEDTAVAYSNFDFYVQPSFAEGLPNAVMEAMIARLPVVATAVGGNSDLVRDGKTGLLFEAGDINALTVCMQRCIDDPETLSVLAEAADDLIRTTYSFDKVVEQVVGLYRKQPLSH